jgi:hypothetical protein
VQGITSVYLRRNLNCYWNAAWKIVGQIGLEVIETDLRPELDLNEIVNLKV